MWDLLGLGRAPDQIGNIWITTMLDGIYIYDTSSHASQHITTTELSQSQPAFGGVSSIAADQDGNIWMAAIFEGKVAKYRYDGNHLKLLNVFTIEAPHMLRMDNYGHIWIGTATGKLHRINTRTDEEKCMDLNSSGSGFISGIQPLDGNRAIVIAFKYPLTIVDISTSDIFPLELQNWDECLHRSFFIPTDIRKDSFGDVWIGTVGNGLLRYKPEDGTISRVEGISCTDIAAIREDKQGNIWISTQYGLNRYDRTSDKLIHFFENDGTGGNQYYDRSSCILPDGTLIFGGTHGVTIFNPVDVNLRRKVPLVFEDLKIHSKSVSPAKNPEIIRQHLSYSPRVNLNHRQNGFSISFAALDYCQKEKPRYLFKLDGHDKYWIDAGYNHECYYANLPHGKYTFRVKITSDNNSILDSEISLPIIIKPSPWMSWWAQLIYAIIVALITLTVLIVRRNLLRHRELASRAIYEKEQEQRINRMNMSFFSNIAHEFRTPLTMISGPLEQLEMSAAIKGSNRELLSIIQRSVGRMLKLVNQLMDFNKLENDTLRLQVERADAVAYLKSFIGIFSVNAQQKGIE
ncbi:MAG: hypothetical protein HUJ93_05765 [Bacteroidales bacterium]|nr:hypothetical protein [Bacteroidales bacterium]